MRHTHWHIIPTALLACLLVAPAFAVTDLVTADLLINGPSNAIRVENGVGPTTVTVVDGADIGFDEDALADPDIWSVLLFEDSVFNMSGGTAQEVIYATDNAVVNVTGGTQSENVVSDGNSVVNLTNANVLDDLEAFGDSTTNVYSGNFDEDVEAGDAAVVNIYGGAFGTGFEDGGQITSEGDSVINIFGGTFTGPFLAADEDDPSETLYDVEALEGGSVHIHGGLFQGGPDGMFEIFADFFSTITIYGLDFEVNGFPAGPGPIPNAGGTISGTLADGTPFHVDSFTREFLPVNEAGQIILVNVPEPATLGLWLLGLVGIAAARRCR
jgi:hypothetical protein